MTRTFVVMTSNEYYELECFSGNWKRVSLFAVSTMPGHTENSAALVAWFDRELHNIGDTLSMSAISVVWTVSTYKKRHPDCLDVRPLETMFQGGTTRVCTTKRAWEGRGHLQVEPSVILAAYVEPWACRFVRTFGHALIASSGVMQQCFTFPSLVRRFSKKPAMMQSISFAKIVHRATSISCRTRNFAGDNSMWRPSETKVAEHAVSP